MKNFFKGYASALNLIPPKNSHKIKSNFIKNDEEALRQDWEIVGKDINLAMEKYERSQK